MIYFIISSFVFTSLWLIVSIVVLPLFFVLGLPVLAMTNIYNQYSILPINPIARSSSGLPVNCPFSSNWKKWKECLQLDSKLTCPKCKTLTCECPERKRPPNDETDKGEESRSRNINNNSGDTSKTSLSTDTNRTENLTEQGRPAAIRLASILGIKNLESTNCGNSVATPKRITKATPAKVQEGTTSSPAANWLMDKYQLMSKVWRKRKGIGVN